MKKINRLFLILFVIDLVVLLGYGQAQEETRATYTYYRVGFYWYYFFPAAYFFGGYLLGQSLLSRSRISAASHCGKNTVHFDFCLSHCLFSTCHYVNGSHFYYLSAV